MNLKKRMMISNAAVALIPVLISAAAGFIFILVSYTATGSGFSYENIEKIARIQSDLFTAGETIWQEQSETLAKTEFQQYLQQMLSDINAEVSVLKDRELVFGTIDLNAIDIENLLSKQTKLPATNNIKLGEITYIYRIHPFTYPEDIQGHILLLVPVGRDEINTMWFLISTLSVFLLSLIITNLFYSIKLSRSIAAPLSKLKDTVGKIIDGDLGHSVAEEGDEELREVSRALEQMRVKLGASINAQLKYDENRKMLISSMSHDLKTPITAIRGYIEGILDNVADTQKKRERYLMTIRSKADQVDSMIDDLLLYSRLDLSQVPFNFENTEIGQFFSDCMEENAPDLERKNIKGKFINTLKEKVYVLIDRQQLRRVVLNLFDNAVKYMSPERNGEITVTIRQTFASVIIEIADNGIGIPAEDQPFVFDRFYRADKARSKAMGSGLGLAIAKRIIESHNGSIWVNSKENEGTRFMISLKKYDDRSKNAL